MVTMSESTTKIVVKAASASPSSVTTVEIAFNATPLMITFPAPRSEAASTTSIAATAATAASSSARRLSRRCPPPLEVLVMGFSFEIANRTCWLLRPLRCAQWPGVRIKSEKDPRLQSALHAGILKQPKKPGSGRGNLGLALAHISAWQLVAHGRDRGMPGCKGRHPFAPTLIMEEDESVRPEQSASIVRLLRTPRAAFEYDLFYLNVLRPEGAPCSRGQSPHSHILCVRRAASESGDRTGSAHGHGIWGLAGVTKLYSNVWMGAYALRPSGASRLMRLLQHDPPDLSHVVLDTWVAHQVAEANSGLRTVVWNTTNELFQHGDERRSDRKSINNDLIGRLDRYLRTLRGPDTLGHPQWLARVEAVYKVIEHSITMHGALATIVLLVCAGIVRRCCCRAQSSESALPRTESGMALDRDAPAWLRRRRGEGRGFHRRTPSTFSLLNEDEDL